jgi:hypothetical protein
LPVTETRKRTRKVIKAAKTMQKKNKNTKYSFFFEAELSFEYNDSMSSMANVPIGTEGKDGSGFTDVTGGSGFTDVTGGSRFTDVKGGNDITGGGLHDMPVLIKPSVDIVGTTVQSIPLEYKLLIELIFCYMLIFVLFFYL